MGRQTWALERAHGVATSAVLVGERPGKESHPSFRHLAQPSQGKLEERCALKWIGSTVYVKMNATVSFFFFLTWRMAVFVL